jgi:hypothetical protein
MCGALEVMRISKKYESRWNASLDVIQVSMYYGSRCITGLDVIRGARQCLVNPGGSALYKSGPGVSSPREMKPTGDETHGR